MNENFPNEGRLPDNVPVIVQKLAYGVKMTPIAWHLYPDKIVIVFEQGPKLTFDRDQLAVKVAIAKPAPVTIAPAIQKLPARRNPKSK
jgi:hypothetical protein